MRAYHLVVRQVKLIMSKASEIMSRFDKSESKSLTNAIKAIEGDDYKKCPISNEKVFECIRDAMREAFAELEARAMPDGYEWPRYEDGSLLRYGNSYIGNDGNNHMAWHIRFDSNADVHVSRSGDGDGFDRTTWDHFGKGERVKRPILAADGEPLEAGQTVYATHYGYAKCTVLAIEWVVDGYLVEVENEGGHKFRQTPDEFTHKRPVLDADGVPVHEGDTVWCVATDEQLLDMSIIRACWSKMREKLTVKSFVTDAHGDKWADFEETSLYAKTCYLTHIKPDFDSWERIEEDKDLNPFDYCKKVGHKLWTFDNAEEFKARDLVRRARALAERGAE